ncbi:unnamed protein product, partial [Cyprideis torosa]
VNCGALPLGLLESELFGHVKGAFTGATRNKPGMFKLADKGTLFLTEVGDMPLPLQVKLLTVLDDRKFHPVGGEDTLAVDVRVIAATHRPLLQQVQQNRFRQDLFYRLNVLHLHLPALREREGDVRYLLDHFLEKYTQALGKTIVGFAPSAMQTLLDYQYPGNIRELSNIVEYSANICKKKKITKEHLPPYLFANHEFHQGSSHDFDESNRAEEKTSPEPNSPDSPGARESWDDIERNMIIEALKENDGNKSKTAQQLGFDLATEILIVRIEEGKVAEEPRTIIMDRPSDEGLCQKIVAENITDVVCGGIEELHYNFLIWKKVSVIDAVIGGWKVALEGALAGTLQQGAIIRHHREEFLSL